MTSLLSSSEEAFREVKEVKGATSTLAVVTVDNNSVKNPFQNYLKAPK